MIYTTTEIDDLWYQIRVDDDVVRFKITMYQLFGVEKT